MTARDVRRDGVREKVIAEARKYAVKRAARSGPYVETVTMNDLARALDAVPDVPPAGYDRLMITMPRSNRDHWPDVPPDMPTADAPADTDLREQIARAEYAYDCRNQTDRNTYPWESLTDLLRDMWRTRADALLPLVRARISDAVDRWLIYASDLESKLTEARAQVEAARRDAWDEGWDEGHQWTMFKRGLEREANPYRAARGETRQP